MNIKGIGTQNNITSIYTVNSANRINNVNNINRNDRLEISNLGKTLSAYDSSDIITNNTRKIQEIKEKLANGTYIVDSKETAKSILKAINEGKKIND